jgi:hypothetical protein
MKQRLDEATLMTKFNKGDEVTPTNALFEKNDTASAAFQPGGHYTISEISSHRVVNGWLRFAHVNDQWWNPMYWESTVSNGFRLDEAME